MSEKDEEQTYIHWLRHNTGCSAASRELYKHAWEVARKAAQILKERYDADRVRVFGSSVHKGRFHTGSDIDLAVECLR